jgi:hypothetical protein
MSDLHKLGPFEKFIDSLLGVEPGLSRMTKLCQKGTIKNFKGMAGGSQKAAVQR